MARRSATNRRMARSDTGQFTGLTENAQARKFNLQLKLDATFISNQKEVEAKLRRTAKRSLRGAAYAVTQYAKATIVRSRTYSRPGQSPHTRGKPRKNLRAAILYDVDNRRQEAVIGPRGSVVDELGHLMEFGGVREKAAYEERPFMEPAMDRATDQFIGDWRGALSS